MSLATLGQKIKAKHPDYNDMSDEEVGQRVLAKYPEYKDIADEPDVPTQPKEPSAMDELGRAMFNPSAQDMASGGFDVVQRGGQAALGKMYGDSREVIKQAVPQDTRAGIGGATKALLPLSIPSIQPILNMFSDQQVGDQTTGVGIDLAAGAGGALAEKGLERTAVGATKGFDKHITSLLKRISGQSGSDIKLLRQLEMEGGRGFVLNKGKSKPEYVGREISPKASELARGRVSSMEPEALREIGVSPEATQIAQDVKGKFGLKEFPTKAKADELFDTVINSAPPESRISPDNLSKAIGELEAQGLDLREFKGIKSAIQGNPNSTEAVMRGSSKRLNQLTPDEYRNLRTYLNNLTDNGNNPFFQKLKSALDMDAESVIPQLSEAKGVFQVSRELPKAENYLDKTKLPEEMSRRLESGADPKNVNVRESLGRLLGPEGESLVKDTQAQRLSKELYAPSNLSNRPVGNVNNILDLVRLPGRFMQRGYEGMRSWLMNSEKGTGLTSGIKPPPINPPNVTPKPTFPKKPIDPEALNQEVRAAQEESFKRAISQGRNPHAKVEPMGYGPLTKKPISPDEIPYDTLFDIIEMRASKGNPEMQMGYKNGPSKDRYDLIKNLAEKAKKRRK